MRSIRARDPCRCEPPAAAEVCVGVNLTQKMYDSLDRALGREPRKSRPLSFNGQRDTWSFGARTWAGLYYHIHVHVLVGVAVRSRVARSNASAPTTVAQTVSIYVRIKILGYQIRARVRLGRSEEGKRDARKEKEVVGRNGMEGRKGRFGKWIVRLFSSKRGCAAANKIHQLVSPVDGRASRSSWPNVPRERLTSLSSVIAGHKYGQCHCESDIDRIFYILIKYKLSFD